MSANDLADLQQRLVRPLLWSILAAVAIYGGSVIVSDLNAVGASAARLGFVGWAIILGLSLVNYGLRFVRWEIYLGYLKCRIPTYLSMAYYIGGFAFTTTPGKAGEAVRSLYLKRHGVAYVHSLAAFFTERFVDLVAMVLLALVVGIYSVSVLAGALSFIPGGLGSTEAVMVLLLKLVGADTATAVAATLICRLATLWFAVIIGGIILVVLEVNSKTGRSQAPNV